jgi:hypothetical protein
MLLERPLEENDGSSRAVAVRLGETREHLAVGGGEIHPNHSTAKAAAGDLVWAVIVETFGSHHSESATLLSIATVQGPTGAALVASQ